ncbi:hypothetical protein [Polyangium sorediatum]|uniref:Uncharacterized protein n=1 Tax=Polyangium sorediatum TaxID=889274 RepID=A0ABT6NPG1_9BACT|nr:hypothetical protein [Polyangium sorediatum]MDI1430199.1 hypothetical protein [Polyangium sorediatum]
MKSTEMNVPSCLGELILLRLLSQGTGETRAAIEKALRAVLQGVMDPEELRRLLPDELGALEAAGLIGGVRRSSYALLPSGKRCILVILRYKSAPTKANWKVLRERYFLICFVERLRPTKPAPAPAPKGVPLPEDDQAFAQRVLAAARATKTGRFGDDKVFISHVLRQLDADGFAIGDVGVFKDRLVSVNRRGLLSLNRADLIEAMDPKDVDASEAKYLSATFHFVRI